MDKSIKYVGYFDIEASEIKRNVSPAALTKMQYIIEKLNVQGYKVQVVSPAYMIDNEIFVVKSKTQSIGRDNTLTTFFSFGNYGRFFLGVNILLSQIFLFFWLCRNVGKNETIIVYHSLWNVVPVLLAKFFKGFKFILELEEVYSDITHSGLISKKLEAKVITEAKSYILATRSISKKFDRNKDYILLYGTYKMQQQLVPYLPNKIIKVVYAGIIDQNKAGAFNAVEAANYLGHEYQLNIIGFGDVNSLLRVIEKNDTTSCQVKFDGAKSGDELIGYLQSCQIGLSTQTTDGIYNETSFPSKIFSYLCAGINVVSSDIAVVKESPVGDLLSYYKNDTPKSIAEAIKQAVIHPREVLEKRIMMLDKKFTEDLENLINNA